MSVGRTWALVVVLAVVFAACSSPEVEDPVAFCDALRAASQGNAAIANVDLGDIDSIALALEDLDHLVELAPDELTAGLETIRQVYGEVLDALVTTAPSAHDDVLRSMQGRLDSASEPALALGRYAILDCALVFNVPQQPTPTPTPTDLDD